MRPHQSGRAIVLCPVHGIGTMRITSKLGCIVPDGKVGQGQVLDATCAGWMRMWLGVSV